ncbi:SDR family oxidoreductase [Flavobacterium algicola]|uniref:SDR family oxidoreductase n=1 Tax=Flavobacterium algicola TaxID=556529 RepID=UPI001EFD75BC|nr:SDR family oxidoreductase [Flavobacterium algicola]MCG9791312.1 SDR family oxidoreductase [Flavobacterium algicola]
MSNEKQNILIAGAHGTTGKIIIELLQQSDKYNPIAMVRKQDQKTYFEEKNIAAVLANLEDEDLSNAVANAHKIIFAAGSKGKNVIGVDQEGAKNLIKAAENSGAKKFVMLSTMGADEPSVNKELEEYLKAKQNADEFLQSSGLDYSIVRPGSLTDNSGTGTIQLEDKLGEHGEIPRADVAKTLVNMLDDNIKHNQVFEIISGDVAIEKALAN